MAAIDKNVTSTPVITEAPITDSNPVGAPPVAPTGPAPVGTPNLRRFNEITGASAGAPRGIWSRPNAGYNGPIEVGRVSFSSTHAALDQIIVENGADGNVPLLQRAFNEASA